MEVTNWIGSNWFDLFQTVAITGGLIFTGWTLRLDIKTRRVDHLLEITKQHREIWTELYRRPELSRVRKPTADLDENPITADEELFVGFLILHLNASFHALQDRVFMRPDGLRKDIRGFFSRSITKAVWDKMKPLQDINFVAFVETCLDGNDSDLH